MLNKTKQNMSMVIFKRCIKNIWISQWGKITRFERYVELFQNKLSASKLWKIRICSILGLGKGINLKSQGDFQSGTTAAANSTGCYRDYFQLVLKLLMTISRHCFQERKCWTKSKHNMCILIIKWYIKIIGIYLWGGISEFERYVELFQKTLYASKLSEICICNILRAGEGINFKLLGWLLLLQYRGCKCNWLLRRLLTSNW